MQEWEATGMTRPKWDGSAKLTRHISASLNGTTDTTEPAWKGQGTAPYETWRLRSHRRNENDKRTRYAHFKTKQFQEWDKDREWNAQRSTYNHRQNIAGEYISSQRKPIGQKGFASAVSALTVNIKMKSLAQKAKQRIASKLITGSSGDQPNLSSACKLSKSKLAESKTAPTFKLPCVPKKARTSSDANMYLICDEPSWKKDRFTNYEI